MVKYPEDTVFRVTFSGVPFKGKKFVVRLALTVSQDWMMYWDGSWGSVSDDKVRKIFNNLVKMKLAGVLGIKKNKGGD